MFIKGELPPDLTCKKLLQVKNYQVKIVSPVEKEYLSSIKNIKKKLEKK